MTTDTAAPHPRLAKMANQIAASVPDPARSDEQTAAHLRTFWTPQMIADLRLAAGSDPEGLRNDVHRALALLRQA
ncbi:MAG: formate dehydrogenase subunit delta [Actinomycetota bacterium]|nr:formate dehydrogenase subunit delta [Actinomycetota bacterium]